MKSETRTSVPWLNAQQAAVYLGKVHADGTPNLRAFYEWRRRNRPKTYRLGRHLRFRVADLDRCIEPEPDVEAMPLRLVGGRRRPRL